jgi:hypothetical protein
VRQSATAAAAAPLVQRQPQVREFAALEGVQTGAVVQCGYSILNRKNYNFRALLKGQSHEKVGEMRVEGDSLGPN